MIYRSGPPDEMNLDEFKVYTADYLQQTGFLPAPQNLEQIEWLADEYPDMGQDIRPTASVRKYLELPEHFAGKIEPFSRTWKERCLVTASEDPEFAAALLATISASGGEGDRGVN